MLTTMADLAPALVPVTGPKLTWYGPDGDRVDLSGRVLANWFVKAANFCAQELDLGTGDHLWLDLPAHWRGIVWAVGAWTCGALVLPGDARDHTRADAVVTATPDDRTAAVHPQVVIALEALALRVSTPMPTEAIDGAAEVTSQPDQLILPAGAAGEDLALGSCSQQQLLCDPDPGGPDRVLVADPSPTGVLQQVPGFLARGASVVIVTDPHADLDQIRLAEGAHPPHGTSA